MKRPIQHQIDDMACQQFKQCLPPQWVARTQSKDYGIDGEVEIFVDSNGSGTAESTGTLFKVQIKGTKSPSISTTGDSISFQLEIESVIYLCRELRVPVIFIVGDVVVKSTWWYAPQIDTDLLDRLVQAEENNQKSLVLHIPLENKLPDSMPQLLNKIAELELFLANNYVTQAPATDFLGILSNIKDLDSTLASYHGKLTILKIERVDRLWHKGDFKAVNKEIDDILSQPESSTELRSAAILYKEKLLISSMRQVGTLQNDRIRIELYIADELKSISKKGPPHLKLFAMIVLRASQLHAIASQDFALFMNWQMHHSNQDITGIDYFSLMHIASARKVTSQKLVRKYNQCLRLLNLIPQIGAYNIFSQAVGRVYLGMIQFCYRLRNENLTEAANSYKTAMLNISDMAIKVAKNLKQWDDVGLIALNSIWLWNTQDEKDLNDALLWARERIKKIEEPTKLKEELKNLEGLGRDIAEQNQTGITPERAIEQEHQIYIQMAESLGIDLSDPNDEIAKIVRIGLQDLNPERVLKNCKYLFVSLGACGIPGQMLGLPTAGFKYIHCTKHGYGIGALTLDSGYETLCDEHCDKCPDKKPHPENWRWARAWQQKQDKIHEDFAKRTQKW